MPTSADPEVFCHVHHDSISLSQRELPLSLRRIASFTAPLLKKKKNVSLAYAPTTLFIGPFINYKTNKANPIAEIAMHRYHKIIEGTNKK